MNISKYPYTLQVYSPAIKSTHITKHPRCGIVTLTLMTCHTDNLATSLVFYTPNVRKTSHSCNWWVIIIIFLSNPYFIIVPLSEMLKSVKPMVATRSKDQSHYCHNQHQWNQNAGSNSRTCHSSKQPLAPC